MEMTPYRKAQGVKEGAKRKIAIGYDPRLFNTINRMAQERNISFARMARVLTLNGLKYLGEKLDGGS